MIRSFKHKGLERFFRRSDYRGIPAQNAERIQRMLDTLNVAIRPEEMNIPSYRFHRLKGGRGGTDAMIVTGNLRMTFAFEGEDAVEVNLEDHY
jgi:proteic killer suppression protein